jgi:hypothetical protein
MNYYVTMGEFMNSNNILSAIFQPSDIVYTGNLYANLPASNSEFFCINPVKDLSSRADENVSVFRNFLIEFDDAMLADQYIAVDKLKKHGLAPTTVTFSGSKSLHLIYSLADSLDIYYKSAFNALSYEITEITGLVPDPACKNPSRLSRMPNFVRQLSNGDTAVQTEISYGGPYILSSKLNELCTKYRIPLSAPEISLITAEDNPNMTLDSFKQLLPRLPGLYTKISTAYSWARPSGMYEELFKLTLWCIDRSGAPLSVIVAYMEEKVFPHLRASGYPEHKLRKPILNAYNWKK